MLAQGAPTDCITVNERAHDAHFGPANHNDPDATGVLNWVQNNQKMRVVWAKTQEDFFVDRAGDPDSGFMLRSERAPHLIDVDQDSWLDLGVVSLIGMVNGDYDFFRYNPDNKGFDHLGTLNGSSFARDQSGYLAADGLRKALFFAANSTAGRMR